MEEQDLKQELTTIDDQVRAITVKDQESFEFAGKAIIELETLKKKIVDYWRGPKEAAHRAHKEITAKESEMIKPVEEKSKFLRGKMSAYLTHQEALRREAQRKVDEERRKQEEAERKKLEAQAVKAEEKGKTEKAEALREKADEVYVPPVLVQAEIEKTTRTDSGTISQKKDISVTITDTMAILRGVVSGAIPASVVTINEVKLKQYIKLQQLNHLNGCDIREVVSAQFRAAR
jgi:hypothetical protein